MASDNFRVLSRLRQKFPINSPWGYGKKVPELRQSLSQCISNSSQFDLARIRERLKNEPQNREELFKLLQGIQGNEQESLDSIENLQIRVREWNESFSSGIKRANRVLITTLIPSILIGASHRFPYLGGLTEFINTHTATDLPLLSVGIANWFRMAYTRQSNELNDLASEIRTQKLGILQNLAQIRETYLAFKEINQDTDKSPVDLSMGFNNGLTSSPYEHEILLDTENTINETTSDSAMEIFQEGFQLAPGKEISEFWNRFNDYADERNIEIQPDIQERITKDQLVFFRNPEALREFLTSVSEPLHRTNIEQKQYLFSREIRQLIGEFFPQTIYKALVKNLNKADFHILIDKLELANLFVWESNIWDKLSELNGKVVYLDPNYEYALEKSGNAFKLAMNRPI